MRRYIVKHFLALFFLLLTMVGGVVLANDASEMDNEQLKIATEALFRVPLKENATLSFFNRYWMPVSVKQADGYYRKLITVENTNQFLVQDFFTDTGRKQSDPVLINNYYELKQSGFLKSIEGPYVTWYQNGQKQGESFYKKSGVLDGVVQSWYNNGVLKLKGFYIEGKKEGKWNEWYPNGRLKLQSNYESGELEGVYTTWYDNGQQQTVGAYRKGMLGGLWIIWNSKGEKISEGGYVANQREKIWTYYLSGKKWAEGNYDENLQDGNWLYWDADGKKVKEILYQKGVKIKEDNF